jgi:hypothetical protein
MNQYIVLSIIAGTFACAGCQVVSSVVDMSVAGLTKVKDKLDNNQNKHETIERKNPYLTSEEKERIYGIPQNSSKCVQFKEKAIESFALAQWDDNSDGCISADESKNATQIPKYAFVGNEEITSIHDLNQFPNLKVINEGAFAGVSQLETVRLLYVTQIGKEAFKDSANLVELHLPNITEIGEYAFNGTNIKFGLEKSNTIEFKDEVNISRGAFSNIGTQKNNTTLIFKFTNKTHNLEPDVFVNNKHISEIYIKFHQELSIHPGAFKNCTSLARLEAENIPTNSEDTNETKGGKLFIAQDAFTGATQLTKFECHEYDGTNFKNNVNLISIIGTPKEAISINVPNPENVILTLPDSYAPHVNGNFYDGKEWKVVRLRDESQFIKEKFIISAD